MKRLPLTLGTAAAAALLVVPVAPAHAEVPPPGAMSSSSVAPTAAQSHSGALSVSWNPSEGYSATVDESFFDVPSGIPGDSAERTLRVRNDGPSDGTMRVSILNVELAYPDAQDAGSGDQEDWYDEVTVSAGGDAGKSWTLSELNENLVTVVNEREVSQGEVAEFSLGYDFPSDSVTGNLAHVTGREIVFDVLVEVGGELPAQPQPVKINSGNPADGPDLTLAGIGAGAVLAGAVAVWLLNRRRRAAALDHWL